MGDRYLDQSGILVPAVSPRNGLEKEDDEEDEPFWTGVVLSARAIGAAALLLHRGTTADRARARVAFVRGAMARCLRLQLEVYLLGGGVVDVALASTDSEVFLPGLP